MTKASKKRANARKAALKKKQSEETKKVPVTEELSKKINTYVKPPESSTKSTSTDTNLSEDPNSHPICTAHVLASV